MLEQSEVNVVADQDLEGERPPKQVRRTDQAAIQHVRCTAPLPHLQPSRISIFCIPHKDQIIVSHKELTSVMAPPHRPPPLPPRKPTHLQQAYGARVSHTPITWTLSLIFPSKRNITVAAATTWRPTCAAVRLVISSYAATIRLAATTAIASSHWPGISKMSRSEHSHSAHSSRPFQKSCGIWYSGTPS